MQQIWDKYDRGVATIGDEFVKLWQCDAGSLKLIQMSANVVYFFTYLNDDFVLRVVHESKRGFDAINAEIEFVRFLLDFDLPLNCPIKSISGMFVEKISTNEGEFYAVVFRRLPGKDIDINDMKDWQIMEWGKTLAMIHNHSIQFQPSKRPRRSYREDLILTKERIYGYPRITEELLKLERMIERFPKNNDNYGLIHYDLESDNLIWHKNKVCVIDFDDSAYYHYIADIAFALEEIREEDNKRYLIILDLFIEGYCSVYRLDSNWRDQLEIFFHLMDIMKYGRILQAYKDTNPKDDPPWLAKMRKRHFTHIEKQRHYLENDLPMKTQILAEKFEI
jgi:Ser/Thr protein kinase RdoA (MazF antagonist)